MLPCFFNVLFTVYKYTENYIIHFYQLNLFYKFRYFTRPIGQHCSCAEGLFHVLRFFATTKLAIAVVDKTWPFHEAGPRSVNLFIISHFCVIRRSLCPGCSLSSSGVLEKVSSQFPPSATSLLQCDR